MKLKATCTIKTLQKLKNIVTKKSGIEIIYLEKEMFNNYLYMKMQKNGETPSGLWIHESIPKYTHRIEMKIGQFIAWVA